MTNEAQKVIAAVLADNGLSWNLLIERLDYIVTLLEEIRDSMTGQDTQAEQLPFEWESSEDEALSA